MTDKCQHTGITTPHVETLEFSLVHCYDCSQWLIQFQNPDGTTKTVPVSELKQLADERDALRARLDRLQVLIEKRVKEKR